MWLNLLQIIELRAVSNVTDECTNEDYLELDNWNETIERAMLISHLRSAAAVDDEKYTISNRIPTLRNSQENINNDMI